jgi:serine/threonine protein kinase
MHQQGLCHRDLKPENCMITSMHHLKVTCAFMDSKHLLELRPEPVSLPIIVQLIDFGLSKHLRSALTLGCECVDFTFAVLLMSAETSSCQRTLVFPLLRMCRVGTTDYLAPELLCGTRAACSGQKTKPAYDACAVDAWALGVMLYLLLTGVYPFEARPSHGHSQKLIEFPPRHVESVCWASCSYE